MDVCIYFHSTQNIMPEGQQGLRALTAARDKMSRSNIGINLQYDIQWTQ